MGVNEEQRTVMASGRGFIAALDQSGGSTPKALSLYGISHDAYDSDEQMFDLVHEMRERLITSPSFSGDKILGTILFEQTMDRTIKGQDSAAFLWEQTTPYAYVLKHNTAGGTVAGGTRVLATYRCFILYESVRLLVGA